MVQLIVTIRKDCETYDQAQVAYEIAKQKLETIPNIKVSANIANHFDSFETLPTPPE